MTQKVDLRHAKNTLGWLDDEAVCFQMVEEHVEMLGMLLLTLAGNEDVV